MKARPIDIQEAIAYAKKWQNENENHAKAHLIPVSDLIACLEEMNILVADASGKYSVKNVENSSIRAYMAIKRPEKSEPRPETEKLLLVGTMVDCNGIHRDLVQGEKPSGCDDNAVEKAMKAIIGSGVFDVTVPCPSSCDPNSPLYNP